MVCTSPTSADGAVAGWNRFVYLIYKLEVTNYCQITSESAVDGYLEKRRLLINEYQFTQKLIESAQAEAWKLAYREWDNRGLGGFRRWCKRDGSHYLEYLESERL